MINSLFMMFKLLIKNKHLYFIFLFSLILVNSSSNDLFSSEGLKIIPPSIGVLLGGLLATIALIFGLLKDSDIKKLSDKHGHVFFDSLNILKYHILLMLFSLASTTLAFIIKMPAVFSHFFYLIGISQLEVFYFIQIFFFLLTLYSIIEVINVLFIIFEIKLVLINKSDEEK